ncbi:MAG: methyltransferase domain-containing protein [Deltaproteobacteria bacterium]|jgi:SAM-dependent methyltransferase|nr:methyltransferase domain-containing protein [Deltaproteobacteria bacterium]
MSVEKRFKERYKTGDTPWDIGKPDFNLTETVTKKPIKSCKALDIGCGTGDNSVWLAQKHFQVTGTDISGIAVEKAREKAARSDVKCTFLVVDFLKHRIEGTPFGFVFDRGCFHAFGSYKERKRFAKNVASNLKKNGLWLSLIGSADEQRQGPGPPQCTANDIVSAVEAYFEILSLTSSHFSSNRPDPPRCWVCLMQKREDV